MREILNLHIGQCGNQMGLNFWETISPEHGIDLDGTYQGSSDLQLQRANVYYKESDKSRYTPRAIFVDLEPGTIDFIQASSIGRLVGPESFISGTGGAGNNWGKGHYTDGAEKIYEIMDVIRKEVERCDLLQGVQVTHSFGGGTGSGLGSLITTKFIESYAGSFMQFFSVVPSRKVSDIVVEPYNAVLGINTTQYSSYIMSQIIDNEALYNICERNLVRSNPTYKDMNSLISCVMSGVTASVRFPGQLNSDLKKIYTNLVPFPRMRYFVQSYAPLYFNIFSEQKSLSVSDLVQELFSNSNVMCDIDLRQGRCMAGSVLFRGKIQTSEAEERLYKFRKNNEFMFTSWIADNLQISYCDVPAKGKDLTAILVSHTGAVVEVFKRINSSFTTMFRRKAFIHWYLSEGMDEMEFTEAESNLNDVISEYQSSYQNDSFLDQSEVWEEYDPELDENNI